MSNLLWVKLPSLEIANGILERDFSSPANQNDDIAALKLLLVFALFGREIKRTSGLLTYQKIEAMMTYDQLCERCSLSRTLVRKGLVRLLNTRLIEKHGEKRVTYIFAGDSRKSWCKLPKKGVVSTDDSIPALAAILNRYPYERNALKLFIYILSVRSNSKCYVDLSKRAIRLKTGIKCAEIEGATSYLLSIGLLSKVEDQGYLKSLNASDDTRLNRYWVIGYSSLNYKSIAIPSDDIHRTGFNDLDVTMSSFE
ncbi:hypothetical protein ACK3ZI_17790 [Aeromonas caviae]|nr:hypothetical protein [Aeromonas dhakensis]